MHGERSTHQPGPDFEAPEAGVRPAVFSRRTPPARG